MMNSISSYNLQPYQISEKRSYLCIVQIDLTQRPNTQSSRVELNDVFNKLLDDLAEIETKCGKDHYTLIAGDFNAGTGERADFIDFDNDIDSVVPETHVLCKPRCSKDKKKPQMHKVYLC